MPDIVDWVEKGAQSIGFFRKQALRFIKTVFVHEQTISA